MKNPLLIWDDEETRNEDKKWAIRYAWISVALFAIGLFVWRDAWFTGSPIVYGMDLYYLGWYSSDLLKKSAFYSYYYTASFFLGLFLLFKHLRAILLVYTTKIYAVPEKRKRNCAVIFLVALFGFLLICFFAIKKPYIILFTIPLCLLAIWTLSLYKDLS